MNNYFSHCRSLSFLGYIHSNFSVNLRIILGDRRKCKWVFFSEHSVCCPVSRFNAYESVKYRQDFAVNSLITTDKKNSAFEAKRKRRQTSEHAMVRKREWERLVLIFSHSGKVKRSNAVCDNASYMYLNWSRVCRCSWFLFSLFLGRAPWFIPHPTGHIGPHSDTIHVSRAATSASSQVSPIFRRSLLTALLQFALGRPGPLLYPATCQYNACCGMRWWSIRKTCPSQRSRLSLSMLSMVCCSVLVLTSTFVIMSFHEMPCMLLCHLWWASVFLLMSLLGMVSFE